MKIMFALLFIIASCGIYGDVLPTALASAGINLYAGIAVAVIWTLALPVLIWITYFRKR